jgi:ATP-binding cassette subfamily B protein
VTAVPLTHVQRDPEDLQHRPELSAFRLLKRVFSYARPHARLRNRLFFQVVLRSALLPLSTWAMSAVIAGPIEHRDLHGIVLGTLGFAAIALFTNWTFHYRYRYALELGEAVIHDMRNDVFGHLMRMPMSFFNKMKVGRIIGRVTSDIDSIRTGVQDVVFITVVQVGQMIIVTGMMLWYDWVLFLVVSAIAPLIYFLNKHFTRRVTEAQRKASESYSRITATLAESVSGVRVTQGFVREDVNAGYFRDLVVDQSRYNLASARTSAVFLPLLEFNSQFFIALLLIVGGWRVLDPHIHAPVGNIVQFFFLASLFFEPIKNIGNQYNAALAAMVGAERVFRLLDTKPAWTDDPEATDLPAARDEASRGMRVEFRDVSFAYDPGRVVLKNISFIAEPGRTIALVGHTGSGKTSITNLAAKMYLPASGLLLLDGHDITRIRSDSLHRQMGVVHQQSFLFEGTVLDNIRFARPDATVPEVVEAVRRLGFLDLVEMLPDGFHTQVGEGGASLSVGQRQLISFARALIADPRLLILDEATSSIDALTESRIQRALATLLSGRTSFVVAHRLSTIRQADLILVLNEGEIVERGTHDELLALGGIYQKLHTQFVQSSAGGD